MFLCLGIVLGIGFGHSFLRAEKTKRDKMDGLGIVLGIVFGDFLCVLWGGVLPVKCVLAACFCVFCGGVLLAFFCGGYFVTLCVLVTFCRFLPFFGAPAMLFTLLCAVLL